MSETQDQEKRLAAEISLQWVEDGMTLGLGSGSTAAWMVRLLGERIREGLRVRGAPTSENTRKLAEQCGVPLVDFEEVERLDLTIDGADEATEELYLTKGGGGALLREKIVASISERVVIIADSSKQVERLGAFPLPVEVVQFAWKPIAKKLEKWGAEVIRRELSPGAPFVTDEGNYILDCRFGVIENPPELAARLDAAPGVMEHGLFVDLADVLAVGRGQQVETIEIQRS